MKQKIKAWLRNHISMWRNRWFVMGWRERGALVMKVGSVVATILFTLWFAAWYAFGPPSVRIDDIEVDLDRSLSLAGTDKDANGIRDDIDNYIRVLAERKAYSEPQVKALEQDARATQGLITVDLSDAKAVRAAADMIGRSSLCQLQRFEDMEAYRLEMQMERLVVNTRQRVVAYMKFNHAMDGTASALPMGDTCGS